MVSLEKSSLEEEFSKNNRASFSSTSFSCDQFIIKLILSCRIINDVLTTPVTWTVCWFSLDERQSSTLWSSPTSFRKTFVKITRCFKVYGHFLKVFKGSLHPHRCAAEDIFFAFKHKIILNLQTKFSHYCFNYLSWTLLYHWDRFSYN